MNFNFRQEKGQCLLKEYTQYSNTNQENVEYYVKTVKDEPSNSPIA